MATAATAPELIDWELAARVGRRVAGGPELPAPAAWSRTFGELSATADRAVGELTGLGGDLPAPPIRTLDRGQWVEGNLGILRRVLRPVTDKLATRRSFTGDGPVPAALRSGTRALTGAQAGALLGYVGQRVLGQFDPGLGATGDAGGGAVWYVVPNLVAAERRHGFRPGDFRLWVALHETTHRRQFSGVPWLLGHVQGLLDAYLATVDVDEEAMRRLLGRAREVAGRVAAGARVDLLDLLVTPEQRVIVDRMQATMTVLEGHGELVMDELGARLVRGHRDMARALRERRTPRSPAERALQQVLGLRQKLDQYARGERFLRQLHRRGGMALVNRVFAAPEAMPTLAELGDPDGYLARAG